MLFLDVNIVLSALRFETTARDAEVLDWLELQLSGHRPVAVSEQVLSSVVRIATHPRVYQTPSRPEDAIAFVDALLAAPAARVVRPGSRHWSIFRELVITQRLRGNDVPDAYLASLAIEQGATFVTRDRGFRRFADLEVLDPLA